MFIVTDVEKAHTIPTPGNLLTIGAVALTNAGEQVEAFYSRVSYKAENADEGTVDWWRKQNEEAFNEAFSWEIPRVHPLSVAHGFAAWINNLRQEEPAFFVANPASFDYPWIQLLFAANKVENPFSHRTLCLRSMRFGIEGGEFGQSRSEKTHNPQIEHHALFDAQAKAEDLKELLKARLWAVQVGHNHVN